MKLFPKKKELTPAQEKARSYFAFGVLILMIITCLLPHKKQNTMDDAIDRAVAVIDTQLDSAVAAVFGPEAKVTDKEPLPSSVTEPPQERKELEDLKIQRDLALQNMNPKFKSSKETVERLEKEIADLEKKVAELPEEITFFVRRIYVELPGGRKLTGFQKTDRELVRSDLVNLIDRIAPDDTSKFGRGGTINPDIELKTSKQDNRK